MYSPRSFYIYENLEICQPKLYSCWEVTCGDNYSYTRTQRDIDCNPRDMLCAVRTISGSGRLIANNAIYDLEPNSLLIINNFEVVKYISVSPVWNYAWYNFSTPKPLPYLTEGTLYSIPIDSAETMTLNEMFDYLKTYNDVSNAITTLLFTTQLYRWIHTLQSRKKKSLPYYQQINECIEYIYQNIHQNINVSELAQKYHFSERHFRQLFIEFTGKSPKAFHKFLRLKSACNLLKTSQFSISEISDSLGYYSQFQFCRDFKSEYGQSPSKYRGEK